LCAVEIQAHRANDTLAIRRLLAAAPSSVELDVGVAGGELVVAHDLDHADASGLHLERALELADGVPVVLDAKCFPPQTPGVQEFAEALRPTLTGISICSFSEPLLARVARLRSTVPTTLLFAEPMRIA